MKIILLLIAVFAASIIVQAEDLKTIKLNAPELDKGKPLMQVLKTRKSSREFSNKKIDFSQGVYAVRNVYTKKNIGTTKKNTQVSIPKRDILLVIVKK